MQKPPNDANGMADSEEQSVQGLHCLTKIICPRIIIVVIAVLTMYTYRNGCQAQHSDDLHMQQTVPG